MELAVRTLTDGWSVRSKAAAVTASKPNQPRRVKVVVRGSHVEAFLDGQLVISSHLCVDRANGCIGLGASGCLATFDDIAVRHLPPSSKTPFVVTTHCDMVAHRGYSRNYKS